MPACAQRSPSEALSPSAGPSSGRPTAISSDVWLRPKLHRSALRPQSASAQIGPFVDQWPPPCGFGPPGVASGSAPLAASASL